MTLLICRQSTVVENTLLEWNPNGSVLETESSARIRAGPYLSREASPSSNDKRWLLSVSELLSVLTSSVYRRGAAWVSRALADCIKPCKATERVIDRHGPVHEGPSTVCKCYDWLDTGGLSR